MPIKKRACFINEETSEGGKGGMISKIKAASKVKMTVIANAKEEKVLSKILSGDDIGTLLLNRKPKQSP